MREHLRLRNIVAGSVLFSPLSFLALVQVGIQPKEKFWAAVALLAVLIATTFLVILSFVQRGMSTGLLSFVFPVRATGGANTWSSSKAFALAQVGRIDEATEEFERLRAVAPNDGILLRQIAEFHLSQGNGEKSGEVLMQLRALPGCTVSDELYATQRLIDLYLGPLQKPERAMVEMRRLADRYPDTPDGQGARAELRRRKAINEHMDRD